MTTWFMHCVRFSGTCTSPRKYASLVRHGCSITLTLEYIPRIMHMLHALLFVVVCKPLYQVLKLNLTIHTPYIICGIYFNRARSNLPLQLCCHMQLIRLYWMCPNWTNTLYPIFGDATVCNHVCCMHWEHLSYFQRGMSTSNWYKMVCMGDLSYAFIFSDQI